MIVFIEGATVIDGKSDAPIADAIIEIDDGVVRRIGPRGSFESVADARRVDYAGRWIIPGIVNTHRHLYYGGGKEDTPLDTRTGPIAQNAKRLLFFGVTHVLSLGLDGLSMDAYLAEQEAGRTEGAKVMFAGFGSSSPGGWQTSPNLYRPTTPHEGREAVRGQLHRKPHVIKIWLDDDHGKLTKMSPDIYEAIIDEAHKHGLKAYCHMFYQSDAKELMRRGIDVLAHSVYDEVVDDEFIELARQSGVTQITTLVGHSQGVVYSGGDTSFLDHPDLKKVFPAEYITAKAGLERAQTSVVRDTGGCCLNAPLVQKEVDVALKNAGRLAEAGIKIAHGTDGGHVFGLDDHREMELLVKAGISPMDAIRIGTLNGAELLGIDSRYGSLEPGKFADFVVTSADPLADITNTRQIAAVWVHGAEIDREALATPDMRE